MSSRTLEAVTRGRVRRSRRRHTVLAALGVAVATMVVVSLMVGQTFYPPGDVLRVILGETVPGASFTVGELRLPRTVLALAAGLCFGMGGVTFQTMLRNPLASPDIIGISSAAAFGIIVLNLAESGVSVFAIVAALGVAVIIYVLSFKDGVAGTRLVLIGIGIAAMLNSATSYILNQAGQWDLQAATRWLNGSLNGSTWDETIPVLIALAVFGPVLLSQARNLTMLQLGDDTAAALGTRLERTRLVSIVAAVGLIAFATSATGPIAFVAFLAGPIAARLTGPGGSLLVPSGLVGALLVLVADFLGQFAFDTRFPVGVITGVLGAPYLIYLLVRTNRAGGSL
ncbi:ABC transporter permease [Micromonospora echinospora]|uniref:Iron complex transport system permease protein n=1 Tax=Micromonospora echinospora TaxID=1877 RepID=A0A1C4ZIP7_MICEC|nr:iron chelate uptake ABC transporter family permease subunit [Micromonospora echinospora]OZV77025.1 ABC transporter permease [Micromonospora echinospora]SCF32930.1 iron complex transport system permease protein [Micromonospora echinospora]